MIERGRHPKQPAGVVKLFLYSKNINLLLQGFLQYPVSIEVWGDLLESKKNWTWATEGQPTQAAQRVGWNAGKTAWNRFVNKSFIYAQKNIITP